MMVDPVRLRAWEILVAVQGGADLDPLLAKGQDALPAGRDRIFLAGLVRGTLQWQGRYDYLIKVFAARKSPPEVGLLCLLRLALHQLLTLDGVPPFAAIDQAVRLCKMGVGRRQAGFVNGLLRNIQRRVSSLAVGSGGPRDPAKIRALFAPLAQDPGAFLAAWHSHPRWLVDSWRATYGEQSAADLCAFNNQQVALDFYALGGEAPDQLRDALGAAGCPVMALDNPGGLRAEILPGRAMIRSVLAQHPELIVQDGTVQTATQWLSEALATAPPGPLVDLCSAPGGKTANLAAKINEQRLVVAMELDAQRTRLLASTLARTRQMQVCMVMGDGGAPPFKPGSISVVLLDGPCSGTGVLRRHPDARWRLRPAIVEHKADLLLDLAKQAVDLLAPQGVLLYATCSLQPQENQDVLARLLAEREEMVPCPDGQGRWQRTWLPPASPGDGFFAARLCKKS